MMERRRQGVVIQIRPMSLWRRRGVPIEDRGAP